MKNNYSILGTQTDLLPVYVRLRFSCQTHLRLIIFTADNCIFPLRQLDFPLRRILHNFFYKIRLTLLGGSDAVTDKNSLRHMSEHNN